MSPDLLARLMMASANEQGAHSAFWSLSEQRFVCLLPSQAVQLAIVGSGFTAGSASYACRNGSWQVLRD